MTRHYITAVVGALTALTLIAAPAHAQSVDDIVARHIKSRGGAEAIRAVQSQRITGTVQTQGIELQMVMVSQRPHASRQDLTLEIPGQGPVQIVSVYDGKAAWTINPMLGGTSPVDVTGRDAEMMRDQSEMDSPLVDYRAKGYDVQLAGTENVGTRPAHKLRVARPQRDVAFHFIDVETGVELKIAGDAPGAPVVEFSDHRPVATAGLVPYQMRIQQGGQPEVVVVITQVEFNVPLDDALFRRP